MLIQAYPICDTIARWLSGRLIFTYILQAIANVGSARSFPSGQETGLGDGRLFVAKCLGPGPMHIWFHGVRYTFPSTGFILFV